MIVQLRRRCGRHVSNERIERFVAKFNQTQLPDLLFGGFSHQKCTRRIPPEGNPRFSTCKGITTFVAIAGCKVVIVVKLLETTTQFCRRNQTDRGKETVYVQNGKSFSFINSCYHSAKHHTRVIMYKDLKVKNQSIKINTKQTFDKNFESITQSPYVLVVTKFWQGVNCSSNTLMCSGPGCSKTG